jgi:hypothetical protein
MFSDRGMVVTAIIAPMKRKSFSTAATKALGRRSASKSGGRKEDQTTYQRRGKLTAVAIIAAYVLLRLAAFTFNENLSPVACLLLGMALSIFTFL